ncbi:hypothetical protein [Micromonospora sp. NPDC047074]|uniref:hypothetical protein n=1 Tax=Micromonospora sp. NPDC047074 TaxID=3154339 RepID=UPI0033C639EA
MCSWQRRPDVFRWTLAEPRTRQESRSSVLAMAGEDALRAEGDCLTLAVATDAEVIGTVELAMSRAICSEESGLTNSSSPSWPASGLARQPACTTSRPPSRC